jgi:TIR domain
VKVFVSYSRDDRAAVRSLIEDLERARVQIWIDEELVGGDVWWSAILQQIRGCDVFLFALSDKSLYSKPCRAELGYAQALGLAIVPVEVGSIRSRSTDPIFALQSIDYRDRGRDSAVELISTLHERARQRAELPDPLPEPPQIPYEYLQRLGASIHDTTTVLAPSVQAQMLFELRSAVAEESDPIVLDDIRKLLLALRERADVTYKLAGEVDSFLSSEPAMSGEAPADASHDGAVPSATAGRNVNPEREHRRRRMLLATTAFALVVVAVVGYLIATRRSPEPPTVTADYNCTKVSAPMTSIEPRADTEPRLRVPQPPGWEQTMMFNPGAGDPARSPFIRFAMINRSLNADNFSPAALVAMTVETGSTVREALEHMRTGLTSSGGTDLSVVDTTVCGLPAQLVDCIFPAMQGATAPRPTKSVLVANQAGDTIYLVAVSMQTTDPANPTFAHDSEMILTGLQVLPPGAGG